MCLGYQESRSLVGIGLQMAVIAWLGRQVLEYGDLGDRNLPGNRLLCLAYAGSEGEVSPILKELIVRRRAYRCCSKQRVSAAGGGHE